MKSIKKLNWNLRHCQNLEIYLEIQRANLNNPSMIDILLNIRLNEKESQFMNNLILVLCRKSVSKDNYNQRKI